MSRSSPHRRRAYLVRHAEVSYFDGDGKPVDPRTVSLTETGRRQADAVAALLRDAPLDRVVCSGLARTRETAAVVLGTRALAIEDVPELREIRAGRLREVPAERLESELAYGFERAGEDGALFIGGEAFDAFEARVLAAWNGLLTGPSWSQLLVVAHDAVNRVLLGWAAGVGRGAMAGFEQDMCCLNIIDVDLRDARVERSFIKAMNVTPYDPAKLSLQLTSMEQVHRAYRPDAVPDGK